MQASLTYPKCLYTRSELNSALELLGSKLSDYGYTVPEGCLDVLSGAAPGGTDDVPVPFQPPEPRPLNKPSTGKTLSSRSTERTIVKL